MKQLAKKMLKLFILGWYRILCTLLPVRSNVVVFMNNLGRSFGGNPKSIYDEMRRSGLTEQYQCYVLLEDTSIAFEGGIHPVKISRLQYYYVLSIAGFIISDTRLPNYIKKRKKATYLQTWHGTPLKKLALDMTICQMAGGESVEEYHKEFKKNSSTWDYLISQNSFSSEVFKRAFHFQGQMLEIGYPRNDILFQKNNEVDIKTLKEKYQLPFDKKVILYAPTWRDNSYYDNASYKMDAPLDYDELYNQLSKEYVILIKYHYMVKERLDFSRYHGFYQVMDASYDISELYLVSDLLVTDYSSVMFDYSLLKRPMIFYVYDLQEYEEELRGFYFDFVKTAPGPLVMTTKELADRIQNTDFSQYQQKYQEFQAKYHSFEHGDAAKRAIDAVFHAKRKK